MAAAINALLSYYARPRLDKGMRVYFAYKLNEPIMRDNYLPAYYRIGITNTTEAAWRLGILVIQHSNIHRVYENSSQHNVPDTSVAEPNENQEVSKGSVFTAAVTYHDQSIGVIGLSSPKPHVTSRYTGFGSQLATLFGALFFAYAQHFSHNMSVSEVVDKIRKDVANHFETELYRAQAQVRAVREEEKLSGEPMHHRP